MSTSKTSSSPSIVLVLCFFSFLLGQTFNAFCTRISSPGVQIVEKIVVVNVEYSFKTLVAVVLAAIVANNALLVLAYRYSTRGRKTAQRRHTASIVDRPDISRHGTLLLLPTAVVISAFSRIPVPRPFWTFKTLYRPLFGTYPRTTLPLLDDPNPTALPLVLATKYTRPGGLHIPDGLPTFTRVFRNLAVKGFRFEGRVFRGRIRFPIIIEKVEECKPVQEEEGHQEDKVGRRPSRASFLQHLAAAALLRKCQFQVNEEACYATVEEIEEECDDKRLHEEERVEPADEDKDLEDDHLQLDENNKDDEQVIEEQSGEIESDRDVKAKQQYKIEDAEEDVKNDQDVVVGKSMDGVAATDATYVDAMASSTKETVDDDEVERVQEDERVGPAEEHKVLEDEHLKLDENDKDDEQVIKEKNEELKNEREIADADEGVKNDQHVKVDRYMDRVIATDATYVDAMASSAEEEIDEDEEETFFDAVSGLEGEEEMKTPGEKDQTHKATRSWSPIDDDLPSYEEFAMGVPSDILFVKKSVDLIHDVCRPPLLSLLSARLNPKVSECGANARPSHISLLNRLGPRIGA
ncbi:hypothetical protein C8R46DRAFT_1270280 [Mycena filopes]|nr:hypothetical protein C8R46DRAFT_1270280 [Mycena filopes]